METKLKINGKTYTIRSKKDIFTEDFQELLEKSYKNKKKYKNPNLEQIYCSCKRKKYDTNVRLYTKKVGDKYMLASYPDEAKEHKFECPFNSEGIENFVKEEDGQIELKSKNILLKTASNENNQKSNTKERKFNNDDIKTERTIKGFNHFIFILINEAYSLAFNIKNKAIDRLSGNMQNITTDEFKKKFYRLFLNTKFKNGQTVEDVLKEEDIKLYFGVIEKIEKGGNYYVYYIEGNKHSLPKEIWYKGAKIAKIGKNYIHPPYFFIRLIKDNKTIRFFIMPVADLNIFVPVESNLERQFVKNNIDKAMYKPLTVAHIRRILTKEIASEFYKNVPPDTRPDFFVFEEGKIKVVEVVDNQNLDDNKYKSRLSYKEKFYEKLNKNFTYERITFS